ncbi:MAG: hypothetical protein Unbinned8138contig1000_47 [Prokaryotic dsDNA virus sp.]|nr:MAG: hypothetical protein Unbinned8138contig1000_47 [Prokaryotic dsDNA virus sp.]|tara:strand:- start:2322 stop:3119 length:798 start_codon:yes stop_codon:yes gene_type:complete
MGVATGIALAISAIGTGASFAQASKQSKLAQDAQASADKAFADAAKELDKNYAEELSIAKQPYEIQRERLAQVAAQGMEIGAESDRLASATAGRVLAQNLKAEQDITAQQIADQQALETAVATENRNLSDARRELNLAQAEGAGIAAAQAQNLSNQAVSQGLAGLSNMGMAAFQASELYGPNSEVDTNRDVQAVTLDPVSSPASLPVPTSLPQQPIVPQSMQLPIQGNFQSPFQSQNMFLPANQTPQYFQMQDALMYNGLYGPIK